MLNVKSRLAGDVAVVVVVVVVSFLLCVASSWKSHPSSQLLFAVLGPFH